MEILKLILNWAVPFVCGTAVTTAISVAKHAKEKTTALEAGVQCLLRAEIIRAHKEYIAKGFCPIYAREALDRTYKAYHNLGGNDVATSLYEEVKELPTGGNA